MDISYFLQNSRNIPLMIIGPDPERPKLGGVYKHIQNLKNISPLDKAVFYDPGSTDGRIAFEILKIIKQCLYIGEFAKKNQCQQVWINSSIYPTAILKLIILLFSMKKNNNIKVRVFFHGGRFSKISFLRYSVIKNHLNSLFKVCCSIHFLSKEQGKEFEQIFPAIYWECYSNFLPSSSLINKIVDINKNILFVGRLVKEKGIYEILKAFKMLLDNPGEKNCQLWIVGDGPCKEDFIKKAEKISSTQIRIFGQLSTGEVEDVLSKAYVLLLPSYDEGFPYVIIEAMQAGIPVITTSTGALKDIIVENENGYFVEKRDTESLYKKLKYVLDNEEDAKYIGKNNSKKFLEFCSKQAAEKYYWKLLVDLTD